MPEIAVGVDGADVTGGSYTGYRLVVRLYTEASV